MSDESLAFQVGDSILVVGTDHDGELGTIIGISEDGLRYFVVFETGQKVVLSRDNLSHRW
jgi:hypothetical protein